MMQVRHWAYALLLSGTILPISAALGQHSAHPSYLPSVSEAYFWGDRSEVYPDPYRAPEKFSPAPGESHPVPRQEVRARTRAERREHIRSRYITPDTYRPQTESVQNSGSEPANFKYPAPELLDSFPQDLPQDLPQTAPQTVLQTVPQTAPRTSSDLETSAPSRWNREGGTAALPHPDEMDTQSKSPVSGIRSPRSFRAAPAPHVFEDVTETSEGTRELTILQDTSEGRSVREKSASRERSILKDTHELELEGPEENASLDVLELPPVPESKETELLQETPSVPAAAPALQPGKTPSALHREEDRTSIILEEVPQEVSDDILLLEAPETNSLTLEEIPSPPEIQPVSQSGTRSKAQSEKRGMKAVPQTRPADSLMNGRQNAPAVNVPSSQSRERSILETTRIFSDPAVQPAGFWTTAENSKKDSSKRSMRYPTTQKISPKKDSTPKSIPEKNAASPQTRGPMPLASGYTSGNYTSQNSSASQTAVSPSVPAQTHPNGETTPSRSHTRLEYPTSGTAAQNQPPYSTPTKRTPPVSKPQTVSPQTVSPQTVSPQTVSPQTVSPQSAPSSAAAPAAVSRSMETSSETPAVPTAAPSAVPSARNDSQQEVATYTPVFSSRNSPMQKLSVAVPVRQVFQDFSEQRFISKGQIHWSEEYIRALNVNEEHLFNALRASDKPKLSQTRCRFSLMEAAVIASRPATAADANRLVHIYDNIEFHLLQQTRLVDAREDLTLNERELLKAETILNFMHQNITHEYSLEGTTMTNLLEYGRFNCVTGSILYCSLAEKAGLNVTAVELPGHAMCWVYLSSGEKLEVETTCASWFRYRNDPETQRKVICKLIRDASPDKKDLSDQMLLHDVPQPISDKRLIAKIYYNRGVDLLSINDYAGALEANAIAFCLDQHSKTTFGNLLATMNNWAIALCNQDQFEQAAALLRMGLAHEPSYPPFQNNHTHVYHFWVEHLYKQGDIREALKVADTAGKEQPSQKGHFTRLQKQIRGENTALGRESIAAEKTGTNIH